MKVRKAIIPAAGLGTRFLPATKAQPKEMLPIVDTPAIQYIVEEAVASGIEDIIIITGRGKRAIEDHFDISYELEETLRQREKTDLLANVRRVSSMADIHYIRQKEPRGLGHAISCAQRFIGNEPFAVLLGDDIVKSSVPCLQQLLAVYERYNTSVIAVQQVPPQSVSKYGIISPKGSPVDDSLTYIENMIEKPGIHEAPSNLAIIGRYVLRPDIFPLLEKIEADKSGEIQLTQALNSLNEKQAVLACEFSGTRFDVGDPEGFIKATLEFALERDDMTSDLIDYMEKLLMSKKATVF
ncbi:UTP--glucose-1-phosphate uridylyltransferase GalU [Fictibacillus aquaticus]|uniref:UTP--glucose-1-phosphate uridylyltransferase GalU n=1 Tax=Fictibacillus aquaticus TaxID=2021314 RepID=UPI0035EDA924